jgi:ADP-ribosyl-[dinitrogen reductase] hydrolase
MPITREKVRGMILGTAIGDALGIPVETWTREQIKEKYPEGVRDYKVPDGHKWYNGQPAGTWSDDTILTLATIKGILRNNSFDLDDQAKEMVIAMQEAMKGAPVGGSGVPGWGYTTVRAVRNLANNVPWSESGKTTDPKLGHGNGVVMRQSPIAPWAILVGWNNSSDLSFDEFNQRMIAFSAMTHYTLQSAIASYTHNEMLVTLLGFDSPSFSNVFRYCRMLFDKIKSSYLTPVLTPTNIDMWEQFDKVSQSLGWDTDKIIAEFGGGSCNVGHSLPFSYAFFVNNHKTIQVLYDVIEAGGDTDTNGSIVGSMLGALHGEAIFPEHLVNGLQGKDEILALTDKFCDTLGLK